jgi:hypothetical protein
MGFTYRGTDPSTLISQPDPEEAEFFALAARIKNEKEKAEAKGKDSTSNKSRASRRGGGFGFDGAYDGPENMDNVGPTKENQVAVLAASKTRDLALFAHLKDDKKNHGNNDKSTSTDCRGAKRVKFNFDGTSGNVTDKVDDKVDVKVNRKVNHMVNQEISDNFTSSKSRGVQHISTGLGGFSDSTNTHRPTHAMDNQTANLTQADLADPHVRAILTRLKHEESELDLAGLIGIQDLGGVDETLELCTKIDFSKEEAFGAKECEQEWTELQKDVELVLEGMGRDKVKGSGEE